MVVYAKVQRDYLGVVIAQIKKANGVKVAMGIHPEAQDQALCIKSRMKEDLLYILREIDENGYPGFSYKVCR